MAIPTLEEKLAFIKPTPATDYEKSSVEQLKVGDYEIGFQRTNDILDEAMEVFVRSSRSSMGVAGDSMIALFTAAGDMVNASCGTYLHAIIQTIIIKFILKNYEKNPGIKNGDIWFANDALYGGIHNPDQVVLMPIFHNDKLMAWVGAAQHTTETGAIEPGGMPVTARARFEEGFCAPPIKIGENFVVKEDFLEMFTLYSMRAPQMAYVDLMGRCTAADRVRTRILEFTNKYSVEHVVGLLRKMLDVGEEGARQRIAAWPDGKYRSVNFNDGVGMMEGLVRSCALTLIKEGDTITFDFTGTSPDTPSSCNAFGQAVIGHISNFIFEYIFHDLPIASSTFAPFEFIFPENSCLNPDIRAATSLSVMICTGTMSAVHSCFGKMIYATEDWRQVSASQSNAGNALVVAGLNQWGLPYADMLAYSLNSEGQGGRATADGINAFGFPWCVFGRAPEVETMENEFPLLIPFSQHWADSCGHGKYRGGVGTAQLWVAYHGKDVWFLCIADNSNLQTPQGLFGGYGPSTVPGISVRNSDILQKMAEGKLSSLNLHSFLQDKEVEGEWINEFFARSVRPFAPGDIMTVSFATSGAGFGDPLERDPQMVLDDLKHQIISIRSAEEIYKVSFSHNYNKVDEEKTALKREAERQIRIGRGMEYDAFCEGWLQQSPDPEILAFFGCWPDGSCVTPVFRP